MFSKQNAINEITISQQPWIAQNGDQHKEVDQVK